MANPLDWLSFGLSAVNGISSLFSKANANNLQKEAFEWQKQNVKDERLFNSNEALRNRMFQSAETQKAYERQLALWNMNNNYNLPSNELSRIRSAGLNPDLMYNNSGVSPSIMPSAPSAPNGSMASSSATASLGNLQSLSMDSNAALDLAQARLLNAQSYKTEKEGDIFSSDAAFRDAYNSGLIDLQKLQITLGSKEVPLKDEELNKLKAEIKVVNKQWELLDQQISNLFSEEKLTNEKWLGQHLQNTAQDIINGHLDEYYQKQIDDLTASIGLKNAQAYEIVQCLSAKIFLMNAQGKLADKQIPYYGKLEKLADNQAANEVLRGAGIELQNGILTIDMQNAQTWGREMYQAQLLGAILGGVGHMALPMAVLAK